jgi:hypothetical protein
MNDGQELIDEMLFAVSDRTNDFPIIDDKGRVLFPVLSKAGIRQRWEEPTAKVSEKGLKGYSGLCLEINDHGNVTVWKCSKNGNRREVASRV